MGAVCLAPSGTGGPPVRFSVHPLIAELAVAEGSCTRSISNGRRLRQPIGPGSQAHTWVLVSQEPSRYLMTVVQPSPVIVVPLHNIKDSTLAMGNIDNRCRMEEGGTERKGEVYSIESTLVVWVGTISIDTPLLRTGFVSTTDCSTPPASLC